VKTRLVKLNDNFSGVKDTYEIVNFYTNYSDKYIRVSLLKKSINATGMPETERKEFTIYNRNETKDSLRIDPEWNSSSTPPKPEGFILDDPETWGDLMWEQIPILSPKSVSYFDDYISWKYEKPAGFISTDIDEFIIRTIIDMKGLPSEKEGWGIEIS